MKKVAQRNRSQIKESTHGGTCELEESHKKVSHLRDWRDRSRFDEKDYKVAKKEPYLVNQKNCQAWKDFCSNKESANDISTSQNSLRESISEI